jgi:hypothetical protein
MITKLSNSEKPTPWAKQFLPPLITGGPLFMLIGLQSPIHTFTWYGYPIAAIGSVMLGAGLVWLFRRQVSLEYRLDELERVKK